MRQFIQGSDVAFAGLERQAQHACVVFQDQEMPPGARPARARVGFEVAPADGSARLLVDRGVVCTGVTAAVQAWLASGVQEFASFADLVEWVRQVLGPCYGTQPEASLRAGDMTDLQAVRDGLSHSISTIGLDEMLFQQLSATVRGQEDALRTLSRRVCRHIAKPTPLRPATFFALGPTGVGKTRTAEILPVALGEVSRHRSTYAYLRLDMNEYQERHRVSQLLGAPQGYVGYGDGAQLIDALSANPRTIVLFDEIEKAHPDILVTLMNAMDSGRLSTPKATGHGREVDCRPAIFLFTSNLEASGVLQELEMQAAFDKPEIVDQVARQSLRVSGIAPELVGRIGSFLVFRPLSSATRAEVAALSIARVAGEYGLSIVHIQPEVVVYILERVRSDGFGARPYEYLVDDVLGAAFAQAAYAGHSAVEVHGGPPFLCTEASAGR